MNKELFLVIDGNSLIHRSFHAIPPMAYNGIPTGAVHGFFMMLFRVLAEQKPTYLAVAFDEHSPTFRHTMYDEYKAGRKPTPPELIEQFRIIKELLPKLDIHTFSMAGYEADDILGTIATHCTKRGIDTMLLTGDRDALQLVNDSVRVLFTKKGISETLLFTPSLVEEHFGFTPAQVIDYKGLVGDASDNIKGVPGVGDKTGVKLLKEYHTLENVLAHASEVKGKLGEKLALPENVESAHFSKKLATILTTVPVDIQLKECTYQKGGEGISALVPYGLQAVIKQAQKLWETQAVPIPLEEKSTIYPLLQLELTSVDNVSDILAFFDETKAQETALYIDETHLSFCTQTRFVSVDLQQDLLSTGISPQEAIQTLAHLGNRPLYVHDVKKFLHFLDAYAIPHPNIVFDTSLALYALNPQEKSYALSNFTTADAQGLLNLAQKLTVQLKDVDAYALYHDIEFPLAFVLYDMEKTGFSVNGNVLKALGKTYETQIEELRTSIISLCGCGEFNINSPKQLAEVLYVRLQLPATKKTKSGFSTDAETLENLQDAHPAIPLLLKYRQLAKFQGTYIEGLQRKMQPDGTIHSLFDQTATATGRISSSEPNLQNIPVRSQQGKEIRSAFVVKEGNVLIDADYSQIELRLLAHMSQDSAMLEAFRNQQDIHAHTASQVYDVPIEAVTGEMRSAAKAVNFGLVYGISGFGLAKNIGISRKEAGEFIKRYFKRFPSVHAFMENAKTLGKEKGYAQTLYNRRRYLPELTSNSPNVRSFGERVAMNMPVQGTAADIIKLAMIKVHQMLNTHFPDAKLILQVHDELLIEAKEAQAQEVAELLKTSMEQVAKLDVQLIADVKIGKNWMETK